MWNEEVRIGGGEMTVKKTINSNLRCPKCLNPMRDIPKSKKVSCMICFFECLPKECIPFKNICKNKECL